MVARHAWELVGTDSSGFRVALDLHRGAQSRRAGGRPGGRELVEAADEFLGPTVRALLVRLSEKDAYTATHTRAVALLASEWARSWA